MQPPKQKSNIRHNRSADSPKQPARSNRSNVKAQLETARKIMRDKHEVYKKLAE